MARLPVPGNDASNWGVILNEFLCVDHNPDGTLKLSGTLSGKYSKPPSGIPNSHLAVDVQASLTRADNFTNVAALNDVTITSPAAGQILAYSGSFQTWVNADPNDVFVQTPVPVITKNDIGLGNVTNDAQLPLTGGALSGSLSITGGNTIRAYHTDGIKYIEIKSDQFWSRITAGGTSGFVLTGAAVQMDASSQIVTNSPLVRPNTNLGTAIGQASMFYSKVYAQRYYLNATAYLDGTTAGVISISDGTNLSAGTTTGTSIGLNGSQKLGFYGATPVVQQTGGALSASTTYSTTERTMINTMWTALRSLGLMS